MSVYEIITDRIIAALEKGVVPWKKPFTAGLPQNLVSKKEYRGINTLLLQCAPYSAPYWLTFKQAGQLNGSVKKGEKGYPVILWKFTDFVTKNNNENETELTAEAGSTKITGSASKGSKRYPLLRYYTVFNVEQCEEITYPTPQSIVADIVECENLVKKTGCTIKDGTEAYYTPATDTVTIPKKECFRNMESYCSVIYHELSHWTGHRSRLNREGVQRVNFGSEVYSKEELIAEMGAAFLCAHTGIENNATIENSSSYISSWLRKLQEDKKMVIFAAAQAQKAAEFIINGGNNESQED